VISHESGNKMKLVVMKFGGASVRTPAHFNQIADLIVQKQKEFARIVVVVSAMGGATDDLLRLAREVHHTPPKREQDMLVSVGERISSSLLAMALDLKGCEAISLTGSQSGIITDDNHAEAKIVQVKPHRILKYLDNGKIVIVAGFQGVSTSGEITTLGRGGSDTSAVALGVALSAEKVEFYKDVGAVFSGDPKIDPHVVKYDELQYDEMLAICQAGAKVLHGRSVELAAKNGLPLHVLPFQGKGSGTFIRGSGEMVSEKVYEDHHSIRSD
jgi:aspartate kinase